MRREGDETNIKQSIIYNNFNNFIFNNLRPNQHPWALKGIVINNNNNF